MMETQDHLDICQGYRELRVSRDMANFMGKVAYFADLIKERENMYINIRKDREKKLRQQKM